MTRTPQPTGRPSDPVAELRAVTLRYGEVVAVQDLDLTVRPGEVLALLGPNGAGKTTVVNLLLGLLRPDVGSARLFGDHPASAAARRRVGAMLQVAKVPDTLRVGEHVELFAAYYPTPLSVERTLDLAGLDGLEDRPYGELSGGQQQRLLFALALVGDPDLLFLDEPTVGLDVATRRALWRRIRELVDRGRTVLLTTHYLEEAEALADRVVVLARGRVIAEGTPAEISARAGGRRLRCRTSLDLGEVSALPGVVRAGRDGDHTELLIAEADEVAVLRELLGRDPGLADLDIRRAGLEEAFLALTAEVPGSGPGADANREAA